MQLATDGQSVIYRVDPQGGVASHTGHASCYWRELVPGGWRECELSCARPRTCTKNDILPGGNT